MMFSESTRRTALAALVAAAVLLLSSCQTAIDNQTSLQATWKYALVSIPKQMTTDGSRCVGNFASKNNRECLAKIIPGRKFPLVLFLHGCAGMRGGSRNAMTVFRSLGYAAIGPDSFARLGRRANCSPPGRKSSTMALRAGEIRYALKQIRTLDWVDQSRLVLAGFSEGGNAVANYGGENAFVGYIVLAWDCRRGLTPSGPVLAIQAARDPIAKNSRCVIGFRSNSDSINVPNAGHDISGYPETVAALRKFLRAIAPLK